MSDDFRIQHSVKTREGDMLNVRAADAAEFEKVLSYVEENIGRIAGLGDLIRAVGTAGNAGLVGTVDRAPAGPPPEWARPQQTPATSPQGNAPVCSHGQMKLVPGGISKRTQAPYDAFWACQGPRESQCKSQKAA